MTAKEIDDWFSKRGKDTMNCLQDNGIVSDNAIGLENVATVDLKRISWMIEIGMMENLI